MNDNKTLLISIDDIAIDTTQARKGKWDDDELDHRLIESIKGIGLIHDIIVRPTNTEKYGGKTNKPYAVVAGSRRLQSMIQAGFRKVPCKVMELSDTEAIAMSFSENIGRKDLTKYQKMITIITWIELLKMDGKKEQEAVQAITDYFGGQTNGSDNNRTNSKRGSAADRKQRPGARTRSRQPAGDKTGRK